MCKTNVQTNFYCSEIKKHNHKKKKKQGYITRLYFRLVLNRLKVKGVLLLFIRGDLAKRSLHVNFHLPTDHGTS
jgi:hypothetical protein